MPYFIKRGEKVQGPFSREQLSTFLQQGKISNSDFVSPKQEGPFFPLGSMAENSGDTPAVTKVQAPTPQSTPSFKGLPATQPHVEDKQTSKTHSNNPVLCFVDSLIETKEVNLPSQEDSTRLEKIYEWCIYSFMLSTLLAMLFLLVAAITLEQYWYIIVAVGTPLSLTWFVIGVWVIRKTAGLIKSHKVMIATDLPVGLTNINFHILGGLFFITGMLFFGVLSFQSFHTLAVSDVPIGFKLLSLWKALTFGLPIATGCCLIGYFLRRPESTLSHLKSHSIITTSEAASISNELLSTTIIMTKNFYAKLPYLLLTILGVCVVQVVSFVGTPLIYKLVVDEHPIWRIAVIGQTPEVILSFYVCLSCLPLSLWLLSIAGIMSVELSLAVLSCGRLAVKKLQ